MRVGVYGEFRQQRMFPQLHQVSTEVERLFGKV